jgi:hypothetical protein
MLNFKNIKLFVKFPKAFFSRISLIITVAIQSSIKKKVEAKLQITDFSARLEVG